MKQLLDRLPKSQVGSALVAATLTSTIAMALCGFSVDVLGEYGAALFVLVPLMLGIVTPIIHGYHHSLSVKQSIQVSLLALAFLGMLFLILAFEGVICIMMSLPIVVPINVVGAYFGFLLQRRDSPNNIPISLIISVFAIPALMSFEHQFDREMTLRPVVTSLIIEAPVETVWKHVIAFPEMEAPQEWLFKAGIAYPINAHIDGYGAGAIRYCNFSTGSFVEPIQVWKENELLQFTVEEQPIPMTELSFYQELTPPHLHGYFVSKKGQFKLVSLANGQTHLEGTTWYTHSIRPFAYWRIWTDHIIHAIHQRVLDHIKKVSEQEKINS
ncbi:MAG: hypothetical protein AAFP19_21540 [Bacteroidota bacterium]